MLAKCFGFRVTRFGSFQAKAVAAINTSISPTRHPTFWSWAVSRANIKAAVSSNSRIVIFESRLDTAKEDLTAKQASIHKFEIETETCREQIVKFREQQFQIKSNKEYKILEHEIALVNEQINDIEDREIELLEDIDNAKADVSKASSELEQKLANIKLEMQQLDTRQKNLESEMEQFKSERDKLASEIDKTWLNRYNRIMENKKDIALVAIEYSACSACHIKLPPQVIYNAKRADSVVLRNFCGRILHTMK